MFIGSKKIYKKANFEKNIRKYKDEVHTLSAVVFYSVLTDSDNGYIFPAICVVKSYKLFHAEKRFSDA